MATSDASGLNSDFIRSVPDSGPVVMVNLVRLRAQSREGNGSGWDAYLRYSAATMPLVKACGGTVLWAGTGEGVVLGDPVADQWHYVLLVRYPSRAAFLGMVTSPEYAAANVLREDAVEEHRVLCTSETYSRAPSSLESLASGGSGDTGFRRDD